ncbi:MAG: DUF2924 domain-containing protein [Rhodospirillales bacterium]|nr:DUF2924 domain-containing protein [Rhodospirillales bacterium]
MAAIPLLSRTELIDRWVKVCKQPPPKGISRRLLEYHAAYRLQVKAFGGLKPSTRRKLLRAANGQEKSDTPSSQNRTTMVAPGTRLVREWHGRTYMVDVTKDGFRCDGQTYKSLSAVAHTITGARWSGPRFFGL